MSIGAILHALRTAWWLVTVAAVVGAATAFGVSLAQTPEYTASTQLFVSTADSATTADVFQGSQFSQQRVTSYAQLIVGQDLAGRVIQRLQLPLTTEHLSRELT